MVSDHLMIKAKAPKGIRSEAERTRMTLASARNSTTILFVFLLFSGAYMYSRCIGSNILASVNRFSPGSVTSASTPLPVKKKIHNQQPAPYSPLNCTAYNEIKKCTVNNPETLTDEEIDSSSSTKECPNYFRWIHEDLRPWKDTGITEEMIARANHSSNFRITIVNGKVYMQKIRPVFQTRDLFTIWGVVQLMRKYPGKLPDLDLMFDAGDKPKNKFKDYQGPNATAPPPVFGFCGQDSFVAIPFPDWSFWGWPEIRIRPWDTLLEDLKEGNRKTKWIDREPYAYWKGNPKVAPTRKDLIKCNVSEEQDWNARLYPMDWDAEDRGGFHQSNLADQCIHRYKIYIEGVGWSVSEKYILACNSLTLLVKPLYYDFFTRSLVAMQHYWPIKENDKCRSIKFAVDWGNTHKKIVRQIGTAASNFIQEDLKMDYVYDYMLHLLTAYAKLMKYKPIVPPGAVEICFESMACLEKGIRRQFMMESMVKAPSKTKPCTLPPEFDPAQLQAFNQENEDSIKEVESWENKCYKNQTK
ncbi:hypothetical protein C5167_023913 [Papaver somniferum]|uniref:Glycosyl transferase CAP10 domain-containing protein n=1 Tax=Papaver somniferum TaxID=3469 RepID=A0A4Y7JQZ9_PAPSO|nr:O-glucosyltransferase rumi-like [Papaver somniferum]RZC62115.1 hypothetical protein C5167_023913 [Papaver somniferum]